MRKASATVEELLEEIHRLEERSGAARTKILGSRLSVKLGTVTNNLRRLESHGLVRLERYRGARLTGEGRSIAMDVLRRHRLVERLLTDILHVGWSRSHFAACKLEHCIDDDLTDAIDTIVGYPGTCPHGNSIPNKSGKMARQPSEPLTELSGGDFGIVVRVLDEEEEGALAYLESIAMVPGTKFKVQEHVPFDGAVLITSRDSNLVVSRKAASLLAVKRTSR